MSKFNRRELFSILPAGAAGCLGCVGSTVCGGQAAPPAAPWTEKADLSWESIFRFTFQRNYIPIMKSFADRIGKEKLLSMLRETQDELARRGMARRPESQRTWAVWTAGLRSPDPMFQHALVAEIVEDSEHAFEFRVKQCLWAKSFRDADAADIGYAGVCHPDFAVASAFNPRMKLIRTKTLMQGDEYCNHRYVIEG